MTVYFVDNNNNNNNNNNDNWKYWWKNVCGMSWWKKSYFVPRNHFRLSQHQCLIVFLKWRTNPIYHRQPSSKISISYVFHLSSIKNVFRITTYANKIAGASLPNSNSFLHANKIHSNTETLSALLLSVINAHVLKTSGSVLFNLK